MVAYMHVWPLTTVALTVALGRQQASSLVVGNKLNRQTGNYASTVVSCKPYTTVRPVTRQVGWHLATAIAWLMHASCVIVSNTIAIEEQSEALW